MDADGMRVDLLEETLDRLDREGRRPKFIYTVPTFQNPAGVTMSLSRGGGWSRWRTSASCWCWRTTRTACCATRATPLPPLYALDGGVYVMYLGTFSKILSPGIRLGWVAAPPPVLEKINLGKQGADLCTSTLSQLMVQAYFERGRWRDYVDSLTDIYRTRRDTMLDALAEHFPPQAEWTRPAAGCSSGRRCPTSSTPPTCSRGPCATTSPSCPARRPSSTAAGATRCGSTSPAPTRTSIREGIRRIGEVVTEQVELYGTLTGERRGAARPGAAGERREMPTPADAGRARPRARRGLVSRVAVLKGGRSLERQVSLRSGARVEDALGRLGHEVVADRRRPRT